MNIFVSIDENFSLIKNQITSGAGLSMGKLNIFNGTTEVGIAYIEGICDKELISNQVISPLLHSTFSNEISESNILSYVQSFYIHSVETHKIDKIDQMIEELFKGNTVLLFNGSTTALVIKSKKIKIREIDIPKNEATVFASKESFTEDIETNLSLIVKRLPTPKLQIETFNIGTLSHTTVKLLWLKDIGNDEIIAEVKRRIEEINIDLGEGSGVLAEIIQDKPLNIFPKSKQTERPDVVSRKLYEGHFAILCNNSSLAIIGPISFWDNFKTMDDYNELSLISSFLRIIRFIAFLISIIISPLYIAFVTYNHTIVPPALALNISSGREGVPFPSIVELLGMSMIIDIIREAGIRMPGLVGYFIGTLGAVIIGQAAVSAGYVSVSLIIVVAFSTIASFGISSTMLINTSRLINYFLIILAGLFGMFGLLNGITVVLWKMVTLDSFGIPYLYPVIPMELEGWKDTLIRAPLKMLKNRLRLFAPKAEIKNKNNE